MTLGFNVAICIAVWHWKGKPPALPVLFLLSLTKIDSGRAHGHRQHRYDLDHCYSP